MQLALALMSGCSQERTVHATQAPDDERRGALAVAGLMPHAGGSVVVDVLPDAFAPPTLVEALATLHAHGFTSAAEVISRRVDQASPKMRLDKDDAHAAALALLALADRAVIRDLHAIMPRSTVELARAVQGRGVPLEEADAIAMYLVTVVTALRFERLGVFDDNHSHVIGREWHEIDYSGEGMTWQSQRDDWKPQGVVSFERAAYIHAYFTGAERLPHWRRVYKPRGRMAVVLPPPQR